MYMYINILLVLFLLRTLVNTHPLRSIKGGQGEGAETKVHQELMICGQREPSHAASGSINCMTTVGYSQLHLAKINVPSSYDLAPEEQPCSIATQAPWGSLLN